MSIFAQRCEAARLEILVAREVERQRVRNMSLELVLHEVREASRRRSSPTPSAHAQASGVGRERRDDAELKARLARARSYQPIEILEQSKQAAPRRVVRYSVGDSRLGAIREVVVPEPPARDRWGRPIKPGLFR